MQGGGKSSAVSVICNITAIFDGSIRANICETTQVDRLMAEDCMENP
jgi:hypothetical protein